MASTDYAHGTLSKHKSPREVHIRRLEHGYHVRRTDEDGNQTEHATEDLDGAIDHVVDHMEPSDPEGQEPADTEADQEAKAPESN